MKVYCKNYGPCGADTCCSICEKSANCSTYCKRDKGWKGPCQGMCYEDDNGKMISSEEYAKLKESKK